MAYAPDGYLTLSETAERLGCDTSSLRHLIRRGFLPAAKPGGVWFVAADVVEVMETLDRPVGRPTELGKAWRTFSSTLLHELAEQGSLASTARAKRSRRPTTPPVVDSEATLVGRVSSPATRRGPSVRPANAIQAR